MVDLAISVFGMVVAAGLLWKASRSPEQQLWHGIGALGWVVFAVSGFTTGRLQLAIVGVAVAIFGVAVLVRRRTTREERVRM